MTFGGEPHDQPGGGPPRVSAGVLVGVSVWRLVIVAFAFIGFGAAVGDLNDPWPGLSQQASLLAGVVYLGLLLYPLFTQGRRHEPRSPWPRGAMTVLLMLVGVTYLTIMAGDIDETWSLFEHLLTPLVVLIDWIAVGRNQANARWWHPLTWVVFPLAYLVYFLAAEVDLYGSFFDPDDSGFAGTVAGFLVAVVAVGYLLYGIGKLKAMIAADTRPGPRSGPWQQPYDVPHPPYQPVPEDQRS
jgi:hypothetical protein